MIPFKILYFFLKVLFLSTFNQKYKIIVNQLLNIKNYANNGCLDNPLMPIRHLKNVILFLRAKKNAKFDKNAEIVLFNDSGESDYVNNENINYLNLINQKLPKFWFKRGDLFIDGLLLKVNTFIISVFLFLLIFPIFPFIKKNRASTSIIISLFPNWVSLYCHLKKVNCRYFYYFNSHPSDSNLIALLLQENGIIVHKVCLNVPISWFYKYLYCDIFTVTLPYHRNEVLLLNNKNNWSVKKIYQWPLLRYQTYMPYIHKEKSKYDFTLGLISSGMKSRTMMNHVANTEDELSEERLIKFLKNFVKDTKINLLILLHPWEKTNDRIYNEAIKRYYDEFKNSNVTISEINKNSLEYFSKIDLCLTATSQLAAFRIFCGYKTIFAPLGYEENLFHEKNIESITCYSNIDLENIINEALQLSEQEFFRLHNLRQYHFKHQNYKAN